MTHTDSTNKTKSSTHNQSQNANTELYTDLMNNIEYFSAFGFLLSRMAYEITHEKQTSD